MALRKAAAYSRRYARPFTRRSSVRKQNYIRMAPNQKVVKLTMGNIRDFDEGKFKFVLKLVSAEKVQMRDNALEAARQSLHHAFEANLLGQYYFAVRVFPHHILRENKMITGAGADRMQTGMAHSFGVSVGRAAMIKQGQEIYVFGVNTEKAAKLVRAEIGKIKAKLPCRTRIITEIKK